MVSVSPAFQAAATADERRVVGYLYKGNEKLYGGDVIQSMKITELCGGGEGYRCRNPGGISGSV